jgi:O-6-methylguanine DNA methyltransferase
MADFFDRVWDVVAQIPEGRVTTYGHIARHLGMRRSARMVGHALHAVGRAGPLGDHLPCHRVVNRVGALTGRLKFETPTVMEERLRAEVIAFLDDGRVDLAMHLWDPEYPDRDNAPGQRFTRPRP